MQAHHEEGFAAETQREMRIGRIGADAVVIGLREPIVLVGERLQPLPQPLLERLLVGIDRTLEHHREAAQIAAVVAIALRPIEQRIVDPKIVPAARHVLGEQHLQRPARQRRFGSDARIFGALDEGFEALAHLGLPRWRDAHHGDAHCTILARAPLPLGRGVSMAGLCRTMTGAMGGFQRIGIDRDFRTVHVVCAVERAPPRCTG